MAKRQRLDDDDFNPTGIRYTSNGLGVFERIKRELLFQHLRLMDSDYYAWLPKPPEDVVMNSKAYFTLLGNERYQNILARKHVELLGVLGVNIQVAVEEVIQVEDVMIPYNLIIYEDDFQILIKEDKKEPAPHLTYYGSGSKHPRAGEKKKAEASTQVLDTAEQEKIGKTKKSKIHRWVYEEAVYPNHPSLNEWWWKPKCGTFGWVKKTIEEMNVDEASASQLCKKCFPEPQTIFGRMKYTEGRIHKCVYRKLKDAEGMGWFYSCNWRFYVPSISDLEGIVPNLDEVSLAQRCKRCFPDEEQQEESNALERFEPGSDEWSRAYEKIDPFFEGVKKKFQILNYVMGTMKEEGEKRYYKLKGPRIHRWASKGNGLSYRECAINGKGRRIRDIHTIYPDRYHDPYLCKHCFPTLEKEPKALERFKPGSVSTYCKALRAKHKLEG